MCRCSLASRKSVRWAGASVPVADWPTQGPPTRCKAVVLQKRQVARYRLMPFGNSLGNFCLVLCCTISTYDGDAKASKKAAAQINLQNDQPTAGQERSQAQSRGSQTRRAATP